MQKQRQTGQRKWHWLTLALCGATLTACAHSPAATEQAQEQPQQYAQAQYVQQGHQTGTVLQTQPGQNPQGQLTQAEQAQFQGAQSAQGSHGAQQRAVPVDHPLAKSAWQLKSVRGNNQRNTNWYTRNAQALQSPVVLEFDGERLSVDGPCNRLNGRYLVSGERILVEEHMAATKMACGDNRLNTLEEGIAKALPKAQQWRITGSTLQLRLTDGTSWSLQAVGR